MNPFLRLLIAFFGCCLSQIPLASSSMLSSYPAALTNYVMVNEGARVSQLPGIAPAVKEVSAMCMSGGGGMHALIQFDRPFSGRVYSLGFGNVHECMYYNGFYSKSVLFSIPLQGCGTKTTHNTRQVVDMVENKVYVQMDKYTLTAADKKYAFVCELAPMPSSGVQVLDDSNEIRRKPINKPILPQNAPRDFHSFSPNKAIQPALLFYGNRQWHIPPQNVNFGPTQNNNDLRFSLASHANNVAESPTVIVPLEDPFSVPTSNDFGHKNNLEKEMHDLNNGVNQQDRDNRDFLSGVHTTPEDPFIAAEEPLSSTSTTTTHSPWAIIPLLRVSKMQAGEPSNSITLPTPTASTGFSVGEMRREVVRMYASQQPLLSPTELDKSIYLEIRKGGTNLANSSRVNGAVKIGEPITLVVHAKAASRDPNQFNIFVHSCYSSDGTEASHIQLIDHSGCSVHSQVLGSMHRQKEEDGKEIVYFFTMKAFKFPVNNDVFFFCSVDISPEYNFPELCPNNNTTTNIVDKKKKVVRRELLPAKEFQPNTMEKPEKVLHEVKVVSKNVSVQMEDMNERFGTKGYILVKGLPATPIAPRLESSASKLVTRSDKKVEQAFTTVQLAIGIIITLMVVLFVLIIFLVSRLEKRRETQSCRKKLWKIVQKTVPTFCRNN